MEKIEILSLVVTVICLLSFSIVFTILFRNYNMNAIDSIKEGNEDIDLIDSCLIEEEKKHSKRHKTWRIISKTLYITSYILVFGFFAFSLTSRILDNNMLIGDTGIVVIATGSMSKKYKENTYLEENNLNDQFSAYDIIQIKKYKENEVPSLYDVVAFKTKEGVMIVHRIIEINQPTSDSPMTFKTKGDANKNGDYGNLYDKLTKDDIVGYYTGKNVPAIGSFVIFLQSNSGIITIVSIGYCVFMFDYYRNKLEKAITDRTNLLVELINYAENNPEITNSFRQELAYKGYIYTFEKGNFIDKKKIDSNSLTEASQSQIISKTISDNNEAEVIVKDINNDKKDIIKTDPLTSLDDLLKSSVEINIESKDSNEAENSLDDLINTIK